MREGTGTTNKGFVFLREISRGISFYINIKTDPMIRGGKEDKLSMQDMFAQFPGLSNLFKQGFSLIPVGLPGGGCLFIF